jgi:hypothetical protein
MSVTSSVNCAASRALLCASLLILGGCGCGKAVSPAPASAVEVATAVQRDTPIYTDWVATLDGYVNAEIQPRVSGAGADDLRWRRRTDGCHAHRAADLAASTT